MHSIIPPKLRSGDHVRVIAPSRSLAIIGQETRVIAQKRFDALGLTISFGSHAHEIDSFDSSSIESRIFDLHEAFVDSSVQAILTVIGGFNSNLLLSYIDWDLIKSHPKILCGFSDITALSNAIFAKTGLVTYSGPHYSSFGQQEYFDYTLQYFRKCLFENESIPLAASNHWSDDLWWQNQHDRVQLDNSGFVAISDGVAQGTIIGGNLGTLNLLQGTPYMPSFENVILFLEDDEESQPHHFDRDLQSLMHLPQFSGVRGLVIGRFQHASNMTLELLSKIINSKKELASMPVIANVDFGHTDPKITFPIGGQAKLVAGPNNCTIIITAH
jgi:muramoyltetrapeptide carboxypeptidase LdcA involved in peptidoglycan recycling